jgi:photosystem II stability/assembly factor-like uncharacterized protein
MRISLKLSFLLSVVSFLSNNLHAQNMPFAFQTPLPTAHKYNDAQMLDANTAVAVGAMGAFIKSTDAGATWNYIWTKTHVDLLGVDFPDMNTGYAVGNPNSYSPYTVVKTIDGGANWDTLNMGYNVDFNDVDFVSADTGWAVGLFGNIYKTNDGGANWVNQGITSTLAFTVVKMINANIGYVAGENGMFYKTIDAGATWNNIGAGTSQNALAMFWRNANEGWISFANGIIKKTIDGGQTWINCSFTNGTFSITSIHMKDSLNGVGATTQADIVRTTNGGQTWVGSNNFGNQHIAVSFYGSQNGVWVGYYGCIQRSTDGGATLQSVTGGYNYYHYNKIKFTDTQNGYCVGEGGNVLKTTNGGQQWNTVSANTSVKLNDLFFVNQNTGYLVGLNGVIRKTINAGTSFTNITGIPTNTDLYSVHFINQNTGWVAGEASAMYKTTNGGASWTQQTLPNYTFIVYKVSFVDANVGYATGASNGNLFKTTDGGNTWTSLPQNMSFLGTITNFQFFSADTGVATTSSWKFLKTTDGGTSWNELASFCVGPPVLHFINENVGVISGDNSNYDCKMYTTVDGGLSWNNTHVPFGPNTNSVYMTDTNSIYMCGDDGSIANFGGIGGITTSSFSINNFNDKIILIYPNPAVNEITIQWQQQIKIYQIELIDAKGKTISTEEARVPKKTIQISSLPPGLYMIKIRSEDQLLTYKFIKQ